MTNVVVAGILAPTGNGGMLRNQALAKVTALLEPYREHRTYGAAVSELDKVFRTEGFSAAMAKGRSVAEAYEEVYLRSYYDPSID